MKAIEAIAAAMAMDERSWRRHANPWSVWTRIPLLAAFAAVIFCRDALGWWTLLVLVVLAAWAVVNPRAFPEPASTDNWASKAVMGERVWLARGSVPIPRHHAQWANGLTLAALSGLMPLGWGLFVQDLWLTAFGGLWVIGAKLWLVDRMVWLYEDMSRTVPEYRAWLRRPGDGGTTLHDSGLVRGRESVELEDSSLQGRILRCLVFPTLSRRR